MLLEIQNLSKVYGVSCGECLDLTGVADDSCICPVCDSVVAMNRVSLSLDGKEVLGIVGESGSGKSTLLQLIYQDQCPDNGRIFYNGFCDRHGVPLNIFEASVSECSVLRNKEMSMIYQNPRMGLNYLFSAGGNIAEKIIGAGERSYEVVRNRVIELMGRLELPTSRVDNYPDTFSGGQQQRIQIAKALSSSPKLLLLDEPTTGLDLSVQAKLLDLIKELQKEMGFAMIIVSHDLGVINHLTDVTMVMKHGCLVEYGLTDQILEDPQQPYTQLLVSSIL
ncbi:MAG: ATP-binding cassette domain-containing protein [Proteobacteria bacterium]|nr:ATP-binding cassette domain-containing protein [Pseudomonadota bacterium]MBU1138894.1 ATP-binding cassette domain-containing protein [Pseudomonadota bacterium]MBU1234023.1 ATP-binding cassette domain-containing protein [Pseudomonadota bacterium]MBU1418750.1 ATP-binding cassette domain-containing protein [Pseudomonadota bacterium]MBU1455486.1 ATP-binding cassette domain-containing protein [Pseudomonadota bacterium]